jgi:DNA-binding response OmpR family regulator
MLDHRTRRATGRPGAFGCATSRRLRHVRIGAMTLARFHLVRQSLTARTSVTVGARILIIDDERSVHDVARAYLEADGYEVLSAIGGRDGLALAHALHPSVVILDLMLPDLPGEEVCTELRRGSDVAIVMLTAKSTEDDRVRGLDLGADDYLAKPFSPRELVARVRALLRRTGDREAQSEPAMTFDDGRLCLDPDRHQALVVGRPVELTPSEFKLLLALARSPGRVFSRFELINRVQGHDYDGYERTIDAHVKNLRRKIEADPGHPRYVQTVHGVGYRLAATGQ